MKIISGLSLQVLTVVLLGSTMAVQSNPSQNTVASEVSHHLSFLGLTIGKNTLADVQQRLGQSEVRKCSQDEEAEREICYVSRGSAKTKVVFTAGFSGAWSDLDGYKMISGQSHPRCYQRCAVLSLTDDNIQSQSGLRIGLTRKQALRLLGKPIRSSAKKLTFSWSSRQPMTQAEIEQQTKAFSTQSKDPFWDVVDRIDMLFANGKVIEIDVHRVISN